MNIHFFQHVEFEGLGIIENWIRNNHHNLTATKFYSKLELPEINEIDFLIIMGGHMSVYDDNRYYWLKYEKDFIERAIKHNKKILGICLGAQLLAVTLGAKVHKNDFKEIGWFPVKKILKNNSEKIIEVFPDELNVFHWHGETFDIPYRAVHFAYSDACRNQGFLYNDNVLALQFHLESNIDLVKALVNGGRDELVSGDFIQNEKMILDKTIEYEYDTNKVLFKMLDVFLK